MLITPTSLSESTLGYETGEVGHDSHDSTSSVGTALTFGFIFMLLVDQIGGAHGSHSHGPGIEFFTLVVRVLKYVRCMTRNLIYFS